MADTTIIYYTSNREDPVFEGRIIRSLLHSSGGRLPIISVSQKPMDLGVNVCVGDGIGYSGRNCFRQFQIGTLLAKTKYVCPAESDMIYPKEYFDFIPPTDDTFYLAAPLYVCFNQRGYRRYYAHKPRGSESAMVVDRKLLLNRMEVLFGTGPMWGPIEEEIWMLRRQKVEFFNLDVPVVTFKTDRNMHRKTPHDVTSRLTELPYYGEVHNLISRYTR